MLRRTILLGALLCGCETNDALTAIDRDTGTYNVVETSVSDTGTAPTDTGTVSDSGAAETTADSTSAETAETSTDAATD